MLYAGASPKNISGMIVTINITSGELPFATWGSYRFLPTASGTYSIVGLSGTTGNSTGTYSYSQNSSYTVVVAFIGLCHHRFRTISLSSDESLLRTGAVTFGEPVHSGAPPLCFSTRRGEEIRTRPPRSTLLASGGA